MSVALRNLPTHSLSFFFGILSPTPSMIVIGRNETSAPLPRSQGCHLTSRSGRVTHSKKAMSFYSAYNP